jgi:hypothetical protein
MEYAYDSLRIGRMFQYSPSYKYGSTTNSKFLCADYIRLHIFNLIKSGESHSLIKKYYYYMTSAFLSTLHTITELGVIQTPCFPKVLPGV